MFGKFPLTKFQGWISDMEIDGPTFVPKVVIFYQYGERFASKRSFFRTF